MQPAPHSLFAQRTAVARVLCCCSHMKPHVCDGSSGCQSCQLDRFFARSPLQHSALRIPSVHIAPCSLLRLSQRPNSQVRPTGCFTMCRPLCTVNEDIVRGTRYVPARLQALTAVFVTPFRLVNYWIVTDSRSHHFMWTVGL
jgi:hypothetical protein